MFEILLIINIILFILTSIFSLLFWNTEKISLSITKYLFIISAFFLLFLGISKFINQSILEIAFSIWGYFYIFTILVIIISLYLYLKVWKQNINSYITIISPFISFILIISIPFIDSARKIVFDSDNNFLISYILPFHIILAISGQILFFFSFAGSIFYLIMELQLRKKSSMKIIYKLPNLESINKFNSWAVSRTFILLSAGLIAGLCMDYIAYRHLFLGTAKEFHIYFSWMMICIIFIIRKKFNISPNKISIINILIFIIIMFLFIFTNIFITKGFHSFI